jgi:hypothetical protein
MFHDDVMTAEASRKTSTGFQAKKLGDRIRTVPEWQDKKVDIMDNIVRVKFETCAMARKALADSGNQTIVEDTVHEFWGNGHDGNGQNMLGRMWMTYRNKLTSSNPKITERRWATRDSQPRCYRCGEPGHLVHQCRKQQNVICWGCGQQGHKQKHCGRFARH